MLQQGHLKLTTKADKGDAESLTLDTRDKSAVNCSWDINKMLSDAAALRYDVFPGGGA